MGDVRRKFRARLSVEPRVSMPDCWNFHKNERFPHSKPRAACNFDAQRNTASRQGISPLAKSNSCLPAICLASCDSKNGMSDHIYKKIELVGSSPISIDEAIKNAVAKAARTVRNMRWLEVVETRAHIEDGQIQHWQVTVKIGFTLD
jgi:flavin-binding protein dodecin